MATYTGTTPDNGLSGMKDQAKDKVEGLKDQVKNLVDAGQDKVHEVKDKLMDAKDKAVEKAESFATTIEGRIKARPLASVAIAFGIGYFAMRIFRR